MQGFLRVRLSTMFSKSFKTGFIHSPTSSHFCSKPSSAIVEQANTIGVPVFSRILHHFSVSMSAQKFHRKLHEFAPFFRCMHCSTIFWCSSLKVSSRLPKEWSLRLFRAPLDRRISGRFQTFQRGWFSPFNQMSADNVVYGLIAANVAICLLWRIADTRFMVHHFMVSLDNFYSGRLHTLVTSAFSHVTLGHIFSNMLGLYFFGMNIGRTFGSDYLLKLYLAGAVGGSILYLINHAWMASKSRGSGLLGRDPSRTPGLGASGAVNAIMLLDIFLNPRATIYFQLLIPIPAFLLGMFLIGKDVLMMMQGDRLISGSAHLGGAAVAAIAWFRIRKARF